MSETGVKRVQTNRRTEWVFDFVLAIYLALIAISINIRTARIAWSTQLNLAYMSLRFPHGPRALDDPRREAIAAFIAVWALALAVFLVLRLISTLASRGAGLQSLYGITAVTAFPFACLYSGDDRFLFLELELACVAVVLLLISLGKWWPPLWMLLLIFGLHFIVWAMFAAYPSWPGLILIWPGLWKWFWRYQQYGIAVYPLLGFLCASYWAMRSQIRFMHNWGNDVQVA